MRFVPCLALVLVLPAVPAAAAPKPRAAAIGCEGGGKVRGAVRRALREAVDVVPRRLVRAAVSEGDLDLGSREGLAALAGALGVDLAVRCSRAGRELTVELVDADGTVLGRRKLRTVRRKDRAALATWIHVGAREARRHATPVPAYEAASAVPIVEEAPAAIAPLAARAGDASGLDARGPRAGGGDTLAGDRGQGDARGFDARGSRAGGDTLAGDRGQGDARGFDARGSRAGGDATLAGDRRHDDARGFDARGPRAGGDATLAGDRGQGDARGFDAGDPRAGGDATHAGARGRGARSPAGAGASAPELVASHLGGADALSSRPHLSRGTGGGSEPWAVLLAGGSVRAASVYAPDGQSVAGPRVAGVDVLFRSRPFGGGLAVELELGASAGEGLEDFRFLGGVSYLFDLSVVRIGPRLAIGADPTAPGATLWKGADRFARAGGELVLPVIGDAIALRLHGEYRPLLAPGLDGIAGAGFGAGGAIEGTIAGGFSYALRAEYRGARPDGAVLDERGLVLGALAGWRL